MVQLLAAVVSVLDYTGLRSFVICMCLVVGGTLYPAVEFISGPKGSILPIEDTLTIMTFLACPFSLSFLSQIFLIPYIYFFMDSHHSLAASSFISLFLPLIDILSDLLSTGKGKFSKHRSQKLSCVTLNLS